MGAKDKVLSVRLEKEVYDKFKALCEEKDLPVSLAVRHVIKDWLQRQSEYTKEGNENG